MCGSPGVHGPSVAEAPEFPVRVLDALRQPLESGEVVVARSAGSLRLPARFLLCLAYADPDKSITLSGGTCPLGTAASEVGHGRSLMYLAA